jgi:VWFA-related protein
MATHIHTWRGLIAAGLAAALLAPPAYADSVSVAVQRVDASQFPSVRAYVSVVNAGGVPIPGLEARAFQVQEDGKPVDQVVVDPSAEGQDPIVTALVIDVSESMADGHKLDRTKEAAMGYVDALGPADRGTIVSFGSRVTVVQDYTADKNALKTAIDSLSARGGRVLYDAVAQTARRQAPQSERRKPVILLTDGLDAASSESIEAAIGAAVGAGAPVYTVGLDGVANRDVLVQIASGTGGRSVFVADPGDLKTTFLAIVDELRRQYLLRYASKLSPDSRSHGLAVQATYLGQTGTGLSSFTVAAPVVALATPALTPTSVPPTPAPTVQPQAASTPVAAGPAASLGGIDTSLLLALLLVLVLVGAAAWYLRQSPRPAPAAASAPAPRVDTTQEPRGDMTEVVAGAAASAGLTFIRPGRDRTPPLVRLAIVHDGQPSELASRDSPITFGRAQDRVTVHIPDPLVSSEHARIRRDGAQFFLEDLQSKNGTQLNGEPIAPGTPRLLKNNDRIYIGDTVVTFAVDSR